MMKQNMEANSFTWICHVVDIETGVSFDYIVIHS